MAEGKLTTTKTTAATQQSRTITRKKSAEANIQHTSAIDLQAFQSTFDPDVATSIINALVINRDYIMAEAERSGQIARAVEAARLQAVYKAEEQGKSLARQAETRKLQVQKAEMQKNFLDAQIPKLLDSVDFLGFDTVQATIDNLAKQLDLKIKWSVTDDTIEYQPEYTGSGGAAS